jgi:hypothetical protein
MPTIHVIGEDHRNKDITKQRILELLTSGKRFHYFVEGKSDNIQYYARLYNIVPTSDVTILDNKNCSDFGMLTYMYGWICTDLAEFRTGTPTAEQVYRNIKTQLLERFQTTAPEVFDKKAKAELISKLYDLILNIITLLDCSEDKKVLIAGALAEAGWDSSSKPILKTVLPFSEELRDDAFAQTINTYMKEHSEANNEEFIVIVGKRHVKYLTETAFRKLSFPFTVLCSEIKV